MTSIDTVTTISSAEATDSCVASCARSVTHRDALPHVLVGSFASASTAAIWRRRAAGGHR